MLKVKGGRLCLDETDVDVYGVQDGNTRVVANTYKLIPGHTYVKDPIVHVTAGSEECYVFVKVVDEIAAIEDATTIADQMTAKGWTKIEEGVYCYKDTVDASESKTCLCLFGFSCENYVSESKLHLRLKW